MKTINNIFLRVVFGIFAWIILLIISPIRLLFLVLGFLVSFWTAGAVERFIHNIIFAVSIVIGYWGTTYSIPTPLGPKNVYTLVNIFTYKARINFGTGWKTIGKITSKEDVAAKASEGLKADVEETEAK